MWYRFCRDSIHSPYSPGNCVLEASCQSITVTHPYGSGSSPYWMARSLWYSFSLIGPGFPSFAMTYDFWFSRSSMRSIGLITAAVPQAPASSNVVSSSSGIGRRSTFRPISSANCIRLRLVIDGRMEVESGVM